MLIVGVMQLNDKLSFITSGTKSIFEHMKPIKSTVDEWCVR